MVFLLWTTCVFAQYPFKKEYPVNGLEASTVSFTATYDKGTLMLCNVTDAFTLDYYVTLIKTDSAGNIQWTRSVGPVDGWPKKIHQTPDSGYVFCYSDLNSPQGYRLVKLDKNGTLVFSRYVPVAAGWFIPYYGLVSMIRNDGGFYVANYLMSTASQEYAWHLCSFDSAGNLLWSEGYNYQGDKVFLAAIDTCSNGDVVMLGDFHDTLAQAVGAIVTRVQSNGTVVWTNYYTGSVMIRPWAIETNGDAIYILNTVVHSGSTRFLLMKLDSAGNAQWSYRYGITAVNMNQPTMQCVENGNVVMIGNFNDDSYLLKTDSIGTMVAARKFIDLNLNEIDTIRAVGYMLSGRSASSRHSLLMTTNYAVKGCADTTVVFSKAAFPVNTGSFYGPVTIPVQDTAGAFMTIPLSVSVHDLCNDVSVPDQGIFFAPVLFPNPAVHSLQITSQQLVDRIEILDAQGRTVLTQQNAGINAMLDVSGLAEGLYCVRVYSGNQVSTQKILIQR